MGKINHRLLDSKKSSRSAHLNFPFPISSFHFLSLLNYLLSLVGLSLFSLFLFSFSPPHVPLFFFCSRHVSQYSMQLVIFTLLPTLIFTLFVSQFYSIFHTYIYSISHLFSAPPSNESPKSFFLFFYQHSPHTLMSLQNLVSSSFFYQHSLHTLIPLEFRFSLLTFNPLYQLLITTVIEVFVFSLLLMI